MIPGVPERIDPAMQPIVDGLLKILDIIDNAKVKPTCTCGWEGEETADEVDADIACLMHREECPGTWWRAWCGCGWTGAKRGDREDARRDQEAHLPCDLPVIRTSAPVEDSDA